MSACFELCVARMRLSWHSGLAWALLRASSDPPWADGPVAECEVATARCGHWFQGHRLWRAAGCRPLLLLCNSPMQCGRQPANSACLASCHSPMLMCKRLTRFGNQSPCFGSLLCSVISNRKFRIQNQRGSPLAEFWFCVCPLSVLPASPLRTTSSGPCLLSCTTLVNLVTTRRLRWMDA